MEKFSVKRHLPTPVSDLLKAAELVDRWHAFDQFCREKLVQPKDKWVSFFYVAVCNQWVEKTLVLEYLDSVGCELFHAVSTLAEFVENQTLNLKTNQNQCNIRQLLLKSIAKPRAVPIYFIALYYRLTKREASVYNQAFSDRILYVLSPLCQHLNLGFIKWRLEDIALKISKPAVFADMVKNLEMRREDREKYVKRFIKSVQILLSHRGLDVVDIKGRAKHLYGIYKKMARKNVDSSMIYDVAAIRIVTHSVDECYEVLNVIRHQYHEIMDEYDDYISQPKANGYQSIHMAVYGPESLPVEVQIKTAKMHQFNQYGAAAHWLYKDQQYFGTKLQKMLSQKHFGQESKEASFVFVLTPLGDVFALAEGATPIDFAYRIHSEVGHQCSGARVNGAIVPLHTSLKTGDTVEIIKRKNQQPSQQWLTDQYTGTLQAKRHIRHWFSRQSRLAQSVCALPEEKKALKWPWGAQESFPWDFVKSRWGCSGKEELLEIMRHQKGVQAEINRHIQSKKDMRKLAQSKKAPLKMNQIVYSLAGCCKPVVGDAIVGYVTRSRGMKIHRQDCQDLQCMSASQKVRMQTIDWGGLAQESSQVPYFCSMICGRKTREQVIEKLKGNLVSADWYSDPKDEDLAYLEIVLSISGKDDLKLIEKSLKALPGVVSFGKRK